MKDIHPLLQQVFDRHDSAMREIGLFDRATFAKGFLTLATLDKDTGAIRQIAHGENVVTNTGRSGLAHLLGEDNADVSHRVDRMAFGDGSGTPSVTSNALFGTLPTTPIDIGGNPWIVVGVNYPNPTGNDLRVEFSATIGAPDGNGPGGTGPQNYTNAALLKKNGDFFSHKTTGSIVKDNTVVLTAKWTIIF